MKSFIAVLMLCLVIFSGPAFAKSYKFKSRTVTKNGKVVSSSVKSSEVCPVCGRVHTFKAYSRSR